MSNHTLTISKSWKEIFAEGQASEEFEKILPDYLHQMRWFGAKTGNIKQYSIENALTYKLQNGRTALHTFVEIVFQTSNTENYLLPVIAAEEMEEADVICEIHNEAGERQAFLIDALYDSAFRNDLFFNIQSDQPLALSIGEFRFSRGNVLNASITESNLSSELLKLEQE